jgi:zinc transport system substrate-binding protein
MREMKKIIGVFTTLLMLCWLGAGIVAAQPGPEKPLVFTGIEPAAYLVKRVAGQRARVISLLKGHQDPHTYEPTPRQMAELAGARAFFLVGLPFEKHLAAKLGAGPNAPLMVDLGQGVPRRRMEAHHHHDQPGVHPEPHHQGHAAEPGHDDHHHEAGHHEPATHDHDHAAEHHGHDHHHGEWDPHIWLSPRTASIIAANAAQALIKLDPAGQPEFERNLAALQADLKRIDLEAAQKLAPFRGQAVMVYHPAFGYFLDAYGLRQLAVETEGKEPGGKELAKLISLARHEKVKVIFLQKSQASAGARQVARSVGAALAELDPLAPDFMANLERITQALVSALGGPR